MEGCGGFGEAAEHEAVPGGENFVVASGGDAGAADGEKLGLAFLNRVFQLLRLDFQSFDDLFRAEGDVEDALAIEVALVGNVVVGAEDIGVVVVEGAANLLRRPEEELAFDAFAVGVLAGVEAAFRAGHFA